MLRWFAIKKTVRMGVKSLFMHGLRSILTTLGIVFGVCSVIAMLAIGEGASREAQEAIRRLGSTNLIIETVEPPEQRADSGQSDTIQKYGLTFADAESIQNTIANVQVAVPVKEVEQQAMFQSRKASVKIVGTIPWFTEISPISVVRGRFISSIDVHSHKNVCVLEESAAAELFTFNDPIGNDVRVAGSVYRVVGIAAVTSISLESNGIQDKVQSTSGKMYIPLTTSRDRFSDMQFSLSSGSRKASKVELQKIIVKVGSVDDVLVVRDIIQPLLDRLHEKQDYRIIAPLELLRQAARTRRIFSIVLGSIAAISLLVGGIGIMNIMLATVSERTREIGIRRALGARKRDIVVQFLTETLILTFAGGVLGIIVGSIIPTLVTYFGKMPTVITLGSLILSFGISALVGVTFGLYPAYRAADMDPIESLRHE